MSPNTSRSFVVAIDGPAAAGKGTLAERLAARLDLPYLDTGLLYRAIGRLMFDLGFDLDDAELAGQFAQALDPDSRSLHLQPEHRVVRVHPSCAETHLDAPVGDEVDGG